jgi:RhoGAP domain
MPNHRSIDHVFGLPLHLIPEYSTAQAILGGTLHRLPLVVFVCVEELYRTGLYSPSLFRDLPNRARHFHLVSAFDSAHNPGSVNLVTESVPDICALLMTYISSLPEPVLTPALFDPFWTGCVIQANPNSDSVSVALAQALIRLLPRPNFSLLLYLFSFFVQVPLSPENGITHDDLARIFAGKLLGEKSKTAARRMMVWILDHWLPISTGLVDPQEDPPGITSRSKEKCRSKSLQIDQASSQASVDTRPLEEHIKMPSLLDFQFPARSGSETSPPHLVASQDGSDIASLYSSQDCE